MAHRSGDGFTNWFDTADGARRPGMRFDRYPEGLVWAVLAAGDGVYSVNDDLCGWDARTGAALFEPTPWRLRGIAAGRWRGGDALFGGGTAAVVLRRWWSSTPAPGASGTPSRSTGSRARSTRSPAACQERGRWLWSPPVAVSGVWDADTGGPPLALIPGDDIDLVAIGEFGARTVVACARTSGAITLHDPRTGDLVRDPLPGHDHGIACIRLSGGELISSGDDRTVRRWTPWAPPAVATLPCDTAGVARSPRTGRLWVGGYGALYPVDP